MTAITYYLLFRQDEQRVRVQIYDSSPYATIQLYVDNALVKETTQRNFIAVIPKNTKVDVLGLTAPEAGQNFSTELDDLDGDKVEFDLPITYLDKVVKVYGDNRTGTINYGKIIATGTANNVVTPTGGIGLGDLTLDQLGDLTLQEFGTLPINATGDPYVKLVITSRLPNGDYRFALVNYNAVDNYHTPYVVTQTIASRPDELEPYVVSYDPTNDQLIISAGTLETTGTYNVYTSPWGSFIQALDYTTPSQTSLSSPIIIDGLRGVETDNTIYIAVRKSAGGVEEKNFAIITFEVVNGDWTGNVPASPYLLEATILPLNAIRLSWVYQVDGVTPDGFNVYSGVSSIDYGTIVATVPYSTGITSIDLDPITVETLYAVRAYRGAVEDQNTDTVTATPLIVPATVTGTGTATWFDV